MSLDPGIIAGDGGDIDDPPAGGAGQVATMKKNQSHPQVGCEQEVADANYQSHHLFILFLWRIHFKL